MRFLKWLGGVTLLFAVVGLLSWGWDLGGFWRLVVAVLVTGVLVYGYADDQWRTKYRVDQQRWYRAEGRLKAELKKSQARVVELEYEVLEAEAKREADETYRRWPA